MKRVLIRLQPVVKGQPGVSPEPFHLALDLARPSPSVLDVLLRHPLVIPHVGVVLRYPELRECVGLFNPRWQPHPNHINRDSLAKLGGEDFYKHGSDSDLPIMAYETEQDRENWELLVVYPAEESLLDTMKWSARPATDNPPKVVLWIDFDGVINLKGEQEEVVRAFPDCKTATIYGRYSNPLSLCFSPSILQRVASWFDKGVDLLWGNEFPECFGYSKSALMRLAWALGVPSWERSSASTVARHKARTIIWCTQKRRAVAEFRRADLSVLEGGNQKKVVVMEAAGGECSPRRVSGLTLHDCDVIDRLINTDG